MTTTWRKTVKELDRPQLKDDTTADVAIIGGGITGVTSAYLLSKAGKKVVLIEKDQIRGQATAHTTAFLTYIIDTDMRDMVKIFGKEKAKLIWQSHKEAIDHIEKIIKDEKIECDFTRCPNYIFAASEKDFEDLKEDAEHARELGFDLSTHTDKKLQFKNDGYVLVPEQAKFHPLKYLFALQEKAEEQGAKFYEKTEAEEIIQKDADTIEVKSTSGTINAKHVIIGIFINPFFKSSFGYIEMENI